MKTCKKCKKLKVNKAFYNNSRSNDGLASVCKYCKPRNTKKFKKLQNWVKFWEWLKGKQCIDCGESDPVVLELDHVRGKKIDSVTSLIWKGRSWESIATEIRKCEIRCANCHRRVTAKRLGWYRYRDG